MRARQLFLAFLVANAVAGCASTAKPLNVGLAAKAYNSLANEFYIRPTSVSIGEFGGSTHLDIRMDDYGTSEAIIYVYESTAPNIIAGIDKYLEWEEMARRDGDLLSKQIPMPSGGMMEANPCMRFHSAAVGEYYLAISVTCSDITTVPTMYLDTAGAQQLKDIARRFSDGELVPTNASKYN